MAFKITTTKHESVACPGASFSLYRKNYRRRIELDKKLAEYNQSVREWSEKRATLLDQARAKALEALGGAAPKADNLIQISQVKDADGATKQVADQVDPQSLPQFQLEVYKHLDWKQFNDLEAKTQAVRLEQLRPIYMDIYLHSADGLVTEDDVPVIFRNAMLRADKEKFFLDAPGEFIDEIFATIDTEIGMNDVERANFELPTTGGAPAVPAKTAATTPEVGTVSPVDSANSGEVGNAVSPTSNS